MFTYKKQSPTIVDGKEVYESVPVTLDFNYFKAPMKYLLEKATQCVSHAEQVELRKENCEGKLKRE